jgi:hypothetical protein
MINYNLYHIFNFIINININFKSYVTFVKYNQLFNISL